MEEKRRTRGCRGGAKRRKRKSHQLPRTLEQHLQALSNRIAQRETAIQQLLVEQDIDKATLNYMLALI